MTITTAYQGISCLWEAGQPGQRFDIGGYCLHLMVMGTQSPTIVLDHSLGGVEGYLLAKQLSSLGKVCFYDRAGYGWSDSSPHPRTSQVLVNELEALLTQAQIPPPYILVGNSFGSYTVRLYAHTYPEKVQGVVLTDGLHEAEMLRLSPSLTALKWIFFSGFLMSILGSGLGLIRVLKQLGAFLFLKPQLKRWSKAEQYPVTRSFCRPKHWLTMARELWNLNRSSQQLQRTHPLGSIPLVTLKADSFFHPKLWTRLIPLRQANQTRNLMQERLSQLSHDSVQIEAPLSSHFIWVDQPELIAAAIQHIIHREAKPL
ncbi:alpha/beta fold hydrolase [Lyngbya confervoides]|uniref:Alpha/beta hydrolase n=1 Tax=Lyngbya confervoides BDU141951 TaxID=1574623 RepID=A0ABD4SYY7_9CYAN|nr:alpha/beta hydrolase [Lyngbya confervoides]MCM1981681.1 alpha/beta hydrolase [Lyngbya confervoides BDU141951]